MAYDEESDRVILFGGLRVADNNWREASLFDGETWAYEVASNQWTEMHPTSGPGPRLATGMTYAAKADRIILFGGVYPGEWGRDETWAYDYNTNTWQQRASGPASHLGCRIAYDAESDRIILFGGYDYSNDTFFNDTWVYDYNSDTWTEMAPSTSPSPRNLFAMAYDAESDRVLVWGQDRPEPDATSMWAYDYNSNTWKEMISNEGPTRNIRLSMAYDVKADRIILQSDADTWAYDYDTNQWMNLAPAQTIGMRSKYDMVYSTAADRIILFGGSKSSSTFNDETWIYNFEANMWTDVTLHP